MAYERPSALSGCHRDGHAEGRSNLPLNITAFFYSTGRRAKGGFSDGRWD